ncbi:hypothetical protein LTR56_016168 [Elasticomyces elasticus]|nr:hypothetical protein LTR56_016168 [Elasticomyces elasticus]KAK3642127.1 hypothetical protein LTR22_016248 [Elasticomyces elasticus]KAK4914175.1 hypothetical protein LTR49_017528 [Elasticomyces elasticus]KAK5762536.1 hypothetical protein LTS12_007327 [Elasticomyces elasticus]
MTSDIPFVRGRPSISIVERTLGLRRARGVGSEKRRLQFKVMRDLDAALVQAVEQYAVLPCDEILTSNNIKAAAYSIFETIGPHVWPDNLSDPTNDRFVWLAKASYDDLEGYYPRNLFYSRVEDRTQLRHSFYHLVVAKCYGYAKHHPDRARQRRSYDRPSACTPSRTADSRASLSSVSLAAERHAKSKKSTEHGAGVTREYAADIERQNSAVQPLVTLHDHEQSHRALELEILRGYQVFQDFSRKGIVFSQDQLTVLMHVMATCPAARKSKTICISELLKVTNGQKMVSLIQPDSLPSIRASRPGSYDGMDATMDTPDISELFEDTTSMAFSHKFAQSVDSSQYAAPRAHAPASSAATVLSTEIPRTANLQPSSECTGNSTFQTQVPQQLNEQAIEGHDETETFTHETSVSQAILERPSLFPTKLSQESESITTADVAFTSKTSWDSDTSDWKNASSHDVDPMDGNENCIAMKTPIPHRHSPDVSEPTNPPSNDESTLYSPRQTLFGSGMKAKEYHTQVRPRSRGTEGCISEVSDSESPITARHKPEHEGLKRRRSFSVPEGASNSRVCKRLLTTHDVGIGSWSRAGDVYEDQDQGLANEFDKDDIVHGLIGRRTSSSSGIDPCQPPSVDLRAVAQLSPTTCTTELQSPRCLLASEDRCILEHLNVEIDWATSGVLPGCVRLGACDSPAGFFGQIDRQNTLKRYSTQSGLRAWTTRADRRQ